jgi:hypothetical protein
MMRGYELFRFGAEHGLLDAYAASMLWELLVSLDGTVLSARGSRWYGPFKDPWPA